MPDPRHKTVEGAASGTGRLAVVAGNARARAFYERQGWSDRGPFECTAETASGPVTVPVRRYERVVG